MTIVTDYKQCRQCGFPRADYELDCSTSEESVDCRMCGHREAVERVEDSDSKITWKHTVTAGSGALFYRAHDGGAFVARYLSSEEHSLWAEKWLRNEIQAGSVHADSAYLTRWDPEKKAVEFVIGTFPEFQGDNPTVPDPACAARVKTSISAESYFPVDTTLPITAEDLTVERTLDKHPE